MPAKIIEIDSVWLKLIFYDLTTFVSLLIFCICQYTWWYFLLSTKTELFWINLSHTVWT